MTAVEKVAEMEIGVEAAVTLESGLREAPDLLTDGCAAGLSSTFGVQI